jgi:hypothetical protein
MLLGAGAGAGGGGNKQKFTNFAIANKAFKDSRKMDLGALAWAERSNKIVKEIIQ